MNEHRYEHLQAILERLKLMRVPISRVDELMRGFLLHIGLYDHD